ncbi:MAG TPA: nucleotidyltransferase family protein, partial [Burkholderiaceae bacterium]|nr:nucleotidyltransferase family protein [Burkholderiaceae bacterium]
WLEAQLVAALGDGGRFGVALRYSMEGRDFGAALETAGGIVTALPLLGVADDEPFWVVSGDIFAPGFAFDASAVQRFKSSALDAHLWLVPNPPYHPRGDFGLGADGLGLADGPGPDGRTWTYANLALLRPRLLAGIAPGTRVALAPSLFEGMRARRISAEVYAGDWANVGTPEQLAALNRGL